MIRLAAPEWLVIVPFLLYVAWRVPRAGLRGPLRLPILLLLVGALAEPACHGQAGVDLWLLLDRSDSARDLLEPQRSEIEELLERSRSREDRLHVVDFASEVQERASSAESLAGSGAETRLASAVRFALGRAESGRAARVLVVSDGYATETLGGLADRLTGDGVPLDLRVLPRPTQGDFLLEGLSVPSRVQEGERFLIELSVRGDRDAEIPVTIARDGTPIGRMPVQVSGGRAVVRVSDRLHRGGAHRYTAALMAEGDPLPGNDRGAAWVEVAGGPRVLLVTAYLPDPLAAALEAQGFEVDVERDLDSLGPGRLAGARLLILNNVPAYRLSRELLESIDPWVRVQGGGLLMVGGRFSFGAGGYFDSPVDDLLPVSMELRREHRKLALNLAIVLDRSGSMGAVVGGGRTKMHLASAGAARSLELLGEGDAVTVFAVDSEAHRVLPLARLGEARGRAIDAVRRISAGGGGIFVYHGLSAAWQELRRAEVGQRHVILFADAADAEEPGNYRTLVYAMTAQGATLSVIGLGTPQDVDAPLLQELARLGNGRMFFSDDATTLPGLFAQETVAVARSAFVDQAVGVELRPGWHEVAGRPLEGLDHVDGYNLSYLRDGSVAALLSRDEYEAPLLAFCRRGAGRSAAVSFPLGGEHSQQVRAWTSYGDFVQTLARWLMADPLPRGIGLRTSVDGTALTLTLLFDDTWQDRLAHTPPRVLLASEVGEPPRELVWERLAPGRYDATARLDPGRPYTGAIAIGDARIPFGPLEVPVEAEWHVSPQRRRELLDTALTSGGRELVDLRAAWRPVDTRAPRPLRTSLLVVALLLFLTESLRARAGWRLPQVGLARLRPSPSPPSPSPPTESPQPSAGETSPREKDAPAASPRERRFRAAKWRPGPGPKR